MRYVLGLLVALLFSANAHAEKSIRHTLDDFGFFGTWAADCDRPAAPDNPVRRASVPDGKKVRFTESLTAEAANDYAVTRAQKIDSDTIRLRILLNGDFVQELTMTREGDKVRTLTNREVPGTDFVVRDGIVLSTGQPTPWLHRCGVKKDGGTEDRKDGETKSG